LKLTETKKLQKPRCEQNILIKLFLLWALGEEAGLNKENALRHKKELWIRTVINRSTYRE